VTHYAIFNGSGNALNAALAEILREEPTCDVDLVAFDKSGKE
jgi:hypothetical protein